MKRHRGNHWFWLLWLLPALAAAQTRYHWQMEQSKTRAAVGEAVMLEYTCRFEGSGYEYVITFAPPKETDAYRMVIDSERQQTVDGKRVNTYRFILFPKRPGLLSIALGAVMKHTSKASIVNTTIGRDNVEDLDYKAKTVELPPVAVDVHANPTGYAGALRLAVDVDKKEVSAFTPVQVEITLQGEGNLDRIPPFALDIDHAKIFTDGLERTLQITDEGFSGVLRQQFAIVSDTNYTVPSVQLEYFDTGAGEVRTLRSDAVPVIVRSLPRRAVPGAAEQPADDAPFSWYWVDLLLAVGAGIVIGRFLLPVRAEGSAPQTLQARLERCRDPERFAALLAIADAEKYREIIDDVERKRSAGEKVDLQAYRSMLR